MYDTSMADPASPDSQSLPAGSSASSGAAAPQSAEEKQLVVVTGISGAGKGSALKAFEDLGYYSVENLPLELLSGFADLVRDSPEMQRAAIVVDVREGQALDRLPAILLQVRQKLRATVLFLDASDAVLIRRFSETRRPHPLSFTEVSRSQMVTRSITDERQMLEAVRNMADSIVDTSGLNVHELRAYIHARFRPREDGANEQSQMLVTCLSFGFKNGVPLDADLLFDVRFLPNPHFVPQFKRLTGLDPDVAAYIRNFPQSGEFVERTMGLLDFLLPHYLREGKSYMTIGFGCTGGQHRSVMMAEEFAQRLAGKGFRVKALHRDMPR